MGMTKEEAKAFLTSISYDLGTVEIECYSSKDGEDMRDAVKVLEQEPRWIPVSDRLPTIADVYRVTRYYPNNVMNPEYLVDACFFDGSDTWYNDNRINHERGYVDNIIAWQENPEPYKAESEVNNGNDKRREDAGSVSRY